MAEQLNVKDYNTIKEILQIFEDFRNRLINLNSSDKKNIDDVYNDIMRYLREASPLKKLLFPVYKDIYDDKGNFIRNEFDEINSPKNTIYSDLMIKKARYDGLNCSKKIIDDLLMELWNISRFPELQISEESSDGKQQPKNIDLKEILSEEEFKAVSGVKEHKTQLQAAMALNKDLSTIKTQLSCAREKVKNALNTEDKITTNELTKMI